MKQIHFKSLLLLFLAFLMPATATAYFIEVDGIEYDIDYYGNQATVYRLVDRSYTGSITIPETVIWKDKTYTVTAIYNGAFSSSSITSITIPNSVSSIGEWAFSDCVNLTSITIPNSVSSIGGEAFNNCENLTSISLPNSITEISARLFKECKRLNNVTIPESVTVIHEEAFLDCENLTDIVIPNSVYMIHSMAFYGTAWYYNQPDGVVYAGLVAYKYKGEMEEYAHITLKEGTLGIADYAFNYCRLSSITIPNTVMAIGDNAFEYCYLLEISDLPTSLISIGDYAFSGCNDFNNNLRSLKNLKTIGNYAFYQCGFRYEIFLPNSIDSIGYFAFSESSVEKVAIGTGITEIPEGLF